MAHPKKRQTTCFSHFKFYRCFLEFYDMHIIFILMFYTLYKIWSQRAGAKTKSQQIFIEEWLNIVKIDPEGTRGLIGLESVSFFPWSPRLHFNCFLCWDRLTGDVPLWLGAALQFALVWALLLGYVPTWTLLSSIYPKDAYFCRRGF